MSGSWAAKRAPRRDNSSSTSPVLRGTAGEHYPFIVYEAYVFRQRPPDAGALFVPTEELVQKSSTAPEGQKDEMPGVTAGNRSDEEHPGERLERVAVPSDEDRHAGGAPDRPADDPQGIDQPRQARLRRAPAILGQRRDLFTRGLADYQRDGSSDRRGGVEIESTASTEAERAHSPRVALRADRREHQNLRRSATSGPAYSVARGGADRQGP